MSIEASVINAFMKISIRITREDRPAMSAATPKTRGAKGPASKIYGANIVPIRDITNVKPTPTPRTTVGNISAENRFRIVYEQLAQNLPKTEIKIFAVG